MSDSNEIEDKPLPRASKTKSWIALASLAVAAAVGIAIASTILGGETGSTPMVSSAQPTPTIDLRSDSPASASSPAVSEEPAASQSAEQNTQGAAAPMPSDAPLATKGPAAGPGNSSSSGRPAPGEEPAPIAKPRPQVPVAPPAGPPPVAPPPVDPVPVIPPVSFPPQTLASIASFRVANGKSAFVPAGPDCVLKGTASGDNLDGAKGRVGGDSYVVLGLFGPTTGASYSPISDREGTLSVFSCPR